jgi:8-oxo-dGTP diphosphatase
VSRLRLRSAVRALVLDPAERLVLVRFVFHDSDLGPGPCSMWALPGGGVEPGEDDVAALRRELHEELGLVLDHDPGPPVWTRTHVVPLEGARGDGQTERIYLVRAPAFVVRPSFTTEELAAEFVHEIRWWTRGELAGADDVVFAPRRLSELLVELLERGPPRVPLDVGV